MANPPNIGAIDCGTITDPAQRSICEDDKSAATAAASGNPAIITSNPLPAHDAAMAAAGFFQVAHGRLSRVLSGQTVQAVYSAAGTAAPAVVPAPVVLALPTIVTQPPAPRAPQPPAAPVVLPAATVPVAPAVPIVLPLASATALLPGTQATGFAKKKKDLPREGEMKKDGTDDRPRNFVIRGVVGRPMGTLDAQAGKDQEIGVVSAGLDLVVTGPIGNVVDLGADVGYRYIDMEDQHIVLPQSDGSEPLELQDTIPGAHVVKGGVAVAFGIAHGLFIIGTQANGGCIIVPKMERGPNSVGETVVLPGFGGQLTGSWMVHPHFGIVAGAEAMHFFDRSNADADSIANDIAGTVWNLILGVEGRF